jgi:hypothetical protein
MSKTTPDLSGNAEDIIARFGGLRPMSTKTDIPVTTIQGWKKRNSIPDNRMEEIRQAARKHGVDLSELGTKQQKPDSATLKKDKEKTPDTKSVTKSDEGKDKIQDANAPLNKAPYAGSTSEAKEFSLTEKSNVHVLRDHIPDDILEQKVAAAEKRAVTKSAFLSGIIFTLGIGAVAVLLWPKAQDINTRIASNDRAVAEIYNEIRDMKSGGSFLEGVIPKEWTEQITTLTSQATTLKDQAAQVQTQVGEALKQAEALTSDVLGQNAGSIDERISRLESHLSAVVADPQLQAFLGKIQGMAGTVTGEKVLDGAMQELNRQIESFQGAPDELEGYLEAAREQSPALQETFANVPTEDMKAAALLLAFEQMRNALNRDGQPFADDLALLKNFVGENNTELQASINRLAPHAESGVLTFSGLGNEFRTLAGNAVVSSLQGEDVGFEEKAKARLNELFSVEKNGKLISGTDTQSKLAKTQKFLDEGELDMAIAEAKTLDGEAAQTMAPWINEAEKTLAARKLNTILEYNIDLRTSGAENTGVNGSPLIAGRMIEDKKSGLKIYIPADGPQSFGDKNHQLSPHAELPYPQTAPRPLETGE